MTPEPTFADVAAPTDEPSPARHVLTIDTAGDGVVRSVAGAWPGVGAPPVAKLLDFVHPDHADLVRSCVQWVGSGGELVESLAVHVRGREGWEPAAMAIRALDDGFTFVFLPAQPDPVPSVLELVAAERDLAAVLDETLATFAELDPVVWATVHADEDDDERLRTVVATTGLDTFRRAVEAAAAGDLVCAWDELGDPSDHLDPVSHRVASMGEGIALAGRHVGIGACLMVPVVDRKGDRVAVLTVWSENAEQLEHPGVELIIERTHQLVALAFQLDAGRRALRQTATHDGLTGLLNRQAFFAHVRSTNAKRHCAVACVDIDEFRAVNEWHGSSAGDDLLVEVAERLSEAMRPGDVVGRISADEFGVLCHEVKSDEAAGAIAERIQAIFDQPFHIGGHSTAVSVSLGMATSAPERTGAALFDAADRTLSEVKESARGSWRLA